VQLSLSFTIEINKFLVEIILLRLGFLTRNNQILICYAFVADMILLQTLSKLSI